MSTKVNKTNEASINKMWQRNLSMARNIHIDFESLFDPSFQLIENILKQYVDYNDTDPVGLLLSLLASIGHFTGNSVVNVTNHSSSMNLFLLLVGPSGKNSRINH